MKARKLKLSLFTLIVALSITQLASSMAGPVDSSVTMSPQRSCLSKEELTRTVQVLSSRATYTELESAKQRLLKNANRSAQCREEVIAGLIEAMDKPEFNVLRDFHLWRYGADLLGELKATESLDLLIKNLNTSDGDTFNLSHFPAINGVIKFGPTALPKLGLALQQNPDRIYRLKVIFCIAQIGGLEAVAMLKNALSLESDSCARKFIQVSIDSMDNPRTPGELAPSDHDKWLSAFHCRG